MKSFFKSKKFIVLISIVTIMIVASVSVYATTKYLSSEVAYTPSDTTWKVDNVESALNDLYQKTASKVNVSDLVEALKYSGLGITENSSYSDIVTVLQNYFPPTVNLLGISYSTSYGSVSNSTSSLTFTYKGTTDPCVSTCTSATFNVSSYMNRLILAGNITEYGGQSQYYNILYLDDITAGTSTALYSTPFRDTTKSVNYSFDISSHAGHNCRLRWTISSWACSFTALSLTSLYLTKV